MAINCAAIPDTLIESELFGHEKGSFTGANAREIGIFEAANGGTVFLDEIGEMNVAMQAKLLRAIQEKEIRRVGGKVNIAAGCADLVSATNKELEQEIKKGAFREDLFYRLNVIRINLPPLRERGSDIKTLAEFFRGKIQQGLRHRDRRHLETGAEAADELQLARQCAPAGVGDRTLGADGRKQLSSNRTTCRPRSLPAVHWRAALLLTCRRRGSISRRWKRG